MEADHLLSVFVPETVRQAFETAAQSHGWHIAKQGMRVVTTFEIVVWDTRTEMVDVVVTNVAREPL